MNENVGVFVFDDKIFSSDVRKHWATNALPKYDAFGRTYEFVFGDVYNALGSAAHVVGKSCKPIRTISDYRRAITQLSSFTASDRAILFFDINLNEGEESFAITEEDISPNLLRLLIEFYCLCEKKQIEAVSPKDLTKWLNDGRQGFLLLFVAATNISGANLEIYIASDAAINEESDFCQELLEKSSQHIVRIVKISLTGNANPKNLVREISDACKRFSAVWWPSYGNIWLEPNSSSIMPKVDDLPPGTDGYNPDIEWFTDASAIVPHNHDQFLPVLEDLHERHPLVIYLQNKFQLNHAAVESLLRKEHVYETLKRTIGGWALIHLGDNQGKRFSLQSLLFAVAFAERLEWVSPQNEIATDSSRPLRELFGAVASLFRHLSKNQEMKTPNSVDVRFVMCSEAPMPQATQRLHFQVDVEFDCTVRTTSSQNLMEKILFLKHGCDGQATKLIADLTDVIARYKLPVRLGIYPVSKTPRTNNKTDQTNEVIWTRFDFSVK
jgi:hypothetical protein